MIAVGQIDTGPQALTVSDHAGALDLPLIHIQGGRGYAGVVAVVLGAVGEQRLNVQRTGGEGHIGCKIHLVPAARSDLDRADLRGGGVLRGAAVDIGQVVKVQRAFQRLKGILNHIAMSIKLCQVFRNGHLSNFYGFSVDDNGIRYNRSNVECCFSGFQITTRKLSQPRIIFVHQDDIIVIVGFALYPTDRGSPKLIGAFALRIVSSRKHADKHTGLNTDRCLQVTDVGLEVVPVVIGVPGYIIGHVDAVITKIYIRGISAAIFIM